MELRGQSEFMTGKRPLQREGITESFRRTCEVSAEHADMKIGGNTKYSFRPMGESFFIYKEGAVYA